MIPKVSEIYLVCKYVYWTALVMWKGGREKRERRKEGRRVGR